MADQSVNAVARAQELVPFSRLGRYALGPVLGEQPVGARCVAVGAGGRYPGLSHSVETDGERVVVRVAAPLDLPLPLPGVGDVTRVTATAAAVITLSE